MSIAFSKYQGAGNDFVMIDNRDLQFPKQDKALINKMCDRRFGIGADGLILLENEAGFDFRMVYFNADGSESTMCGNGGRCIVAFARQLGVIEDKARFNAIDGVHLAEVMKDGEVSLGMIDVNEIEQIDEKAYFLFTGSPHYVRVVDRFPIDFVDQAKAIRHNERFNKEGVNVNFIIINGEKVQIRTFERGVEDETLACGTGSVAAAIVAHTVNQLSSYKVKTQGGDLKVTFKGRYKDVLLQGPALLTYKGTY